MLDPQSPVSVVASVGPKFKTLLEKLEIFTVDDLLYHFPFRYDDFSKKAKVSALVEGEIITVEGILGEIKNVFTKYGKRLTTAKLVDETGSLNVVWFNSHYLVKTLKPNHFYRLSGKIGKFSNKLTLTAPSYEEVGEKSISTSRLVPIYPETAGISSKWLAAKVHSILADKLAYTEFLPAKIMQEEHFQPILDAFRSMHFPSSIEEAYNAKKRFAFEELFLELINVESRKKEWETNLLAPKINSLIYQDKIDEFISNLPFKLTPSQHQAVVEIFENLKTAHPMNRLLEGDVGTGKTIVAVIACYLNHLNGYTSLYMAPTEILVAQHYETFKRFLEPLGVEVHLQTGSKKTKKTPESSPTINIGTHALLFDSPSQNIGLVIIDEQHRFGVEQRTKLVNMNKNKTTPHLLTMTATPIPRTLALTLYGDLRISVLDAPPNKDKKITTKVVTEKDRDRTFETIAKSGEQTFIVCPFIEQSTHESFENVKAATAEFEKLKDGVFKNVPIALLHGKMKPKEKQEIVAQFEQKKVQVLVSTPVIEVGIDIPDATIIVIESAERYGLASLHQLRGRVGRGAKPGFCFLFLSGFNRPAYERLKNMETVTNGLVLAEIDMKMRGHGDIYGIMQHGFTAFKVASLTDTEMLNKAKKYAELYHDKLLSFPNLASRIAYRKGQYVGNN